MQSVVAAVQCALLTFLLLVGCAGGGGSSGVTKPTRTTPLPTTTVSVTSSATLSTVAPTSGGPVVAAGHGWRGHHLDGPTFPAGSCHIAGTVAIPLPDRHCTPGATDSAVTSATLASTICLRGYTATIRPPSSVTTPAKRESALEYGFTGLGEYDHLIPLELGGASDTRNLWLEPGKIPNAKDKVENGLKALVCAHKLTLAVAQQLIADDWTTAMMLARGGST